MESDLSKVEDQVPPRNVEVASYLKKYHQCQKMFLQAHQEALYLAEIFQNVHLKFLDLLDHLQSHPVAVKTTKTTVSPPPTGQNWVEFSYHIWRQ